MVVSQRSGRSHKPLKLCGRKVSQVYIYTHTHVITVAYTYIILYTTCECVWVKSGKVFFCWLKKLNMVMGNHDTGMSQ